MWNRQKTFISSGNRKKYWTVVVKRGDARTLLRFRVRSIPPVRILFATATLLLVVASLLLFDSSYLEEPVGGYDEETALSEPVAEASEGGEMVRHLLLQSERLLEKQKQIAEQLGNGEEFDVENALAATLAVRKNDGTILPSGYFRRRFRAFRHAVERNIEYADLYEEVFRKIPHRWPVERESLQINSPFGRRRKPFSLGRYEYHKGLDLKASRRDLVLAAADGVVVKISHKTTGYGNMIRLLHPSGYETLYAHLDEIYLKKGDVVRAGQPIGRAGSTGHSTGVHLHYEVKRNDEQIDPNRFLSR